MSESQIGSCHCQTCGVRIEFPLEMAGTVADCPSCQQPTELSEDSETAQGEAEVAAGSELSVADILGAFRGEVRRKMASPFYIVGLAMVALVMVVLPVVYLGMIVAAGWATCFWAKHGLILFEGGLRGGLYVGLLRVLLYIGPLFAGVVLVLFMIKPIFARRAPRAQPLALNPASEPLLFTFIAKICDAVRAPFPQRIELDCQLNAAASFRRGAFSFLRNDLVLTIGLPLVAGLSATQLAGVLAHEFGHFAQGAAMRLSYIIRSVNGWFMRVIYERDAWDVTLEEWAETEDWKASLVVNMARMAVGVSRRLLWLLMLFGHAVSCFMLRQMEYDADRCEIELAGSETFETTTRRIHVLNVLLGPTYKNMRTSWNLNRHLPDSVPAYLLHHDLALADEQRMQLEDTMGLEPTRWFSTHPSNGDRIRRARQSGSPGVFGLDVPASALFANFEAISKQVTLVHYADDLRLPLPMTKLMPVPKANGDRLPEIEAIPAAPLEGPSFPNLRLRLKK